jgi:hypothetical protein
MHAHHDGEGAVDVAELLHDAAVPGLAETEPAVLLVDEHAGELPLAQVADHVVADPALLLRLPDIEGGEVVARTRHSGIDAEALLAGEQRERHDQLGLDLPEEEPLGEARLRRAVHCGCGGALGALRR